MANGRPVELDMVIERLDGGFVGVWDDVTVAHERKRVTRGVAAELAESSGALTQLGDAIARGTEEVSAQAAAVAAGAEEMSASIRNIATSSERAAAGSATAVGAADVASARLTELNDALVRVGAVS